MEKLKDYIVRNFKLWLCGLLIPVIASTAANLYFAGQLKKYSAKILSPEPSFGNIVGMLITTMLVMLLLSGIDDIGRYIFSLFAVTSENNIRQDIFTKQIYACQKGRELFGQGELLARYNTDTAQSARIVSQDIHSVIYPIIAGCGYLIAVMASEPRIGFLMLFLGLCVLFLNILIVNRMTAIQHKLLLAHEEYTKNSSDAIYGKISIRQYSAKQMMIGRIADASQRCGTMERRLSFWRMVRQLTSDFISHICIYLLPPFACLLAVRGYIGVPVVLFIHQLCQSYVQYMKSFGAAFVNYRIHRLSYKRIYPLLSLPEEDGMNKEYKKSTVSGEIAFEHICVAYGEKNVIRDCSFVVRPGEIVGLVGESGSGKTTLVKALLRLVAYTGKIQIGGRDIKTIPLGILRNSIAYSPEHSEVFRTTIDKNIRYGNLTATEEQIKAVKKAAAIFDEELPGEKNVGEAGSRLSGGQRQKVSIARALIKDAPILIFDEPTAALDSKSEQAVLTALLQQKEEGKSILLLTHKESTLRVADRVVYL